MIRVFFIIENKKTAMIACLQKVRMTDERINEKRNTGLCGANTGAIEEPIKRRAGVGLWDVLEMFCGLCLAGLSVD